ncbi:MAG: acyl-CoA dehydrogenase [Planctomycetes bacterium]|nr:acyl-CoA dehydrogenase [Planctomycetota bacterium]
MTSEALPFFEDRHRALAAEVDRFVAEKIAPLAERDEDDVTGNAREYVARFAAAGLLRHAVPSEIRSICLVRERLARASALADSMFAMQGLGGLPIALYGNDAQKREWMGRIERGAIAAFALTEETAGSDPSGMQLRAERHGGGYRLTGSKTFISNAGLFDVAVVFARFVHPEAGDVNAFDAFIVPGNAPGLSAKPIALISPHPIGTLAFDGVEVPESARLGDDGAGLRIAFATLDRFRATVGAAACGMAWRALDETIAHVGSRTQFGKPIGAYQGVQFQLAEMATELDAARLLVARAAWEADRNGRELKRAAAMAKLFATDHAHAIVDRAVQLHGGKGLVHGHPVERLYRDVRALRIYEGTSEIQKLVIAREITGR